jgi:hypothetical protein
MRTIAEYNISTKTTEGNDFFVERLKRMQDKNYHS